MLSRASRLGLSWLLVSTCAVAQTAAPIKLGGMCDRTGSTRVIGASLCQGLPDYFALINSRGGVQGRKLQYTEIDHAYVAPRAVEAYEQLKRDGAVTIFTYGVPPLRTLSPRYMADRIPSLNPGTGRADAIDGTRWRYIFPGTASYWSQVGVALKYVKDNGGKAGTRIAFLYVDNAAGREGEAMAEIVARKESYVLHSLPVQPPGYDLEAQVSEIVGEFKADWVIASVFGRAAAVTIKAMHAARYPLHRVIALTYGAGEADVEAAGWDIAQGYLGVHFTGIGRNPPVIGDIVKMLRAQGKEVPPYVGSAYYNRGVLTAALMTEAVRQALAKQDAPLTGDMVRIGYESIRDFELSGLAPPITFTEQDHEGGGHLRIYQVKGREWVPVSDWTRGYRDEVMSLVRKANAN